ncbi:zinc finger protein 729-like isoform X2 [Maniola jurtina]|uniref:zinc finger protein 729-like isoform X2 n=1 Tax=Maniola jurtina TaxID=191418 RepID=UPI001E685EDA|nr:zinc finger protein 729-like isoform X2 [Maniola jurtina]
MSSDIDIEEHDVLDNPRIRGMFPDITIVKTEVEDYEEGNTPYIEQDYHTHHHHAPIVIKEENNLKSFNNKIIIGSKPCMTTLETQKTVNQGTSFQGTEIQGTSLQRSELQGISLQGTEAQGPGFQGTEVQGTSFQGTELQDSSFEEQVLQEAREHTVKETVTSKTDFLLQERKFQNKIILGTKIQSSCNSEESPSGDEESDLPDAYVLLEDCKNSLYNNPRFCKECQTLFATRNDMDAHKMISHSFLVAVNKNKAVKSTSKGNAIDADCKTLLCNHCNVVFPNTIALLRHTYELLPGNFACDKCDLVFENDAACKAHMAKHNETNLTGPAGTYAICKICSCHFRWSAKLRTHMLSFHRTKEMGDVKHVPSDLKCHFCSSKMNSTQNYNKHILKYHTKLYHGSYADFEKISKFQCPRCSLCFSSDYSVRIHLAAKHGYLGSVEDSKKLANFRKTPKESKKIANLSQLPAKSQKNITRTRPLTKSTLFKCNKCHIHFVSCISAVLHSRSCVPTSKKDNYRCHQCRRTFKLQDKFYHDYQHSVSDRFKVIEISRNILNRIICKCTSCEICFDEKSFMTFHTDSCNKDSPSMQCKECNVWIHARAMPLHKKIHASGLTSRDFIFTEYHHVSMAIKEQEKVNLINKHERKVTKIVKIKKFIGSIKTDKKSLYYCPTCKCCMRANVKTHKHYIGQCNTDESQFLTCKSCGLTFTQKGFVTHRNIHKMFPRLKLNDLKFIDIQNGNEIAPPFPNFKKCKKCKVTFFSAGALNNHACNSEESKICKYCHEKFSDLAYKLHLPFHEYAKTVETHEDQEVNDMSEMNENIPELMKKYKSIKQVWNILYLCQSCDIVIDSYDKVVEHCQDHFCNMQSYNVTITHCDVCDLNFVDACFKRHEKLHLNYDMDKDSFIILAYKYENLPSDSWMDMFKGLTKEQIQLILSKSMYKFARCVRMKVVSKGSLELTLYQCGKCKLIVAPNIVMEHSQNVNDSCVRNRKKYSCSICSLKFAYRSHKILHENLHETRKLDVKSFRIVQFHADKQFRVTEVKNVVDEITNHGKRKEPDGLKFIRCQHCGKLINKHKYRRHIQYHEHYNLSKSNVKSIKEDAQQIKQTTNKILNFYVCRDCKLCVAKPSIKLHICEDSGSKRKCVKCSLLFRSQCLASHYKSHEKKKFNRSHMRVMYFDGEVIDKKPIKRAFFETRNLNKKMATLYQCSQCTLCIWNRSNLGKHVCSSDSHKFTCKLCGLAFLTSKRKVHEKIHEHMSFNSNDIKVIKFNKNPGKYHTMPPSRKREVPTNDETDELEVEKRNIDSTSKRKVITSYEGTVAKRPRVDYVKTINDFVPIANRYFKCKTCKLLFVTATGLIEHEKSCDTDRNAVKCVDCGLVFHASMINDHKALLDCKRYIKDKVYILTIKQIGNDYNSAENWIIQCFNCDTYNISIDGFQYHLKGNHQPKYTIKTCEKCNIKFFSTSYKFHLRVHHGEDETDISELSIASIEDTTLVEALQDLPDDEDVVYVDHPPKRKLTNRQTVNRKTSSGIYTCDVCGLSFVNPRSLEKHKYNGKHTERKVNCNLCSLIFTSRSLRKHMGLHHKDHKKSDGVNTSVDESNSSIIDDNQSDTSIVQDDETDMDELSMDDNNDVDPLLISNHNDRSSSENSTKDVTNSSRNAESSGMAGIYKCDVCDMNFLTEHSVVRHQRVGKHNEARHECKECGLIFSFISVKKHMHIHHSNDVKKKIPYTKKTDKTDADDSIVESISKMFVINPPHTSSIQDNTTDTKNLTTINNENNSNENITKNINNSRPIEEDNIMNKVGPSRNVENNSNNMNEVLNKNKLFKCSICNVYFLTSDDCVEHITNHIQLDTFEYIACKICDLQFCCEFLGRHMKSHREKTFSTEDLIVAEYHPSNSGEVKIDTYLFVDRIKTKLVSTTIDDTEVVDSTTENLVDSQSSASIDDASESSLCVEAVTGSEA